MTFYLKYRPQTIDQLDLAAVREKLTSILAKTTIPHAYLFCGPKGLGKTSAARIFTKTVNCLQRVENLGKKIVDPCNTCANCRAVNTGRAIDLIEIDAASNRGIDDIRSLKEKIGLMPSSFVYKVYVIDEVHMLTTEAFNALLKTLEEPPEHALFILCTTNPEKIPATILSRVIRINFLLPSATEIKRSLQRVIKSEKLNVDKDGLDQIIKQAGDSFRDAHKLLEQLSFDSRDITADRVIKQAGLSGNLNVDIFLQSLAADNIASALEWVDLVRTQGVETDFIFKEILSQLRLYLLAEHGFGPKKTKLFSGGKTRQLIDLFINAAQSKNSPLPVFPLELAVLDYFSTGPKKEPSSGRENITSSAEKPTAVITGQGPAVGIKENKQEETVNQKSVKKNTLGSTVKTRANDWQKIIDCWPELLQRLQPVNHSITALLRSARPLELSAAGLKVEVYYQFHKSRLENSKISRIINTVLDELMGRPVRIYYVLGKQASLPKQAIEDQAVDNELLKTAEDLFEGR